ncbi:hypothetical protein Ocin01_05080 [Orchesella cincta]|uniref:Uncharacterized protein n=1 Tax=Orchesella cincta TaxID=48709 RepID=A0A1D2N8J5_ORCCI|nr:hypothetical protein Ocin01_05080 [Orchesella cincta]
MAVSLIWVHIQLFHRGKRHLVSPEDGFWAYEQHASSSSMIGLYMIEGVCNTKKIRDKVKQVVTSDVVQGKMTRRLRDFCGFAIWEEVDMKTWSVDQHIKIARWPKSDKRSKDKGAPWSDKDVMDYLTTFQDRPAPRSKASWEVIIIPNVRMGGSETPHYACIFHVHHALMDGISSANILHQILADKPFKFTMDPVGDGKTKKPGYFVTTLMYLAALFLLPRTGLVKGFLELDNQYNRFYSPGKTLKGPKHFAWSRPVKMEAIKKIKDTTKSSVMTVLLSSLGGSYRKMELNRGGKGKKQPYIPEYYHALSPVAMLPYPDRHPRNGFSGVTLPVAVGKYASAYDRLQSNHKAFKDLNIGIMDVLGNFILINMVGLMPTVLQRIFGGGVHFKLSLSNIPGSEEEIKIFDGDRIVDMGAWLPCKFTLGMAMGLFSYGGRCRATMVGDQTYLSKSDVELLIKNFETEICELGQTLGMTESEIFY